MKIDNRAAYVYGMFLKNGLEPHPGFHVTYANRRYLVSSNGDKRELLEALDTKAEEGEGKKGSRELYNYRNRFAFLRSLHTDQAVGDVFNAVVNDIRNNKVVIIDLPTLRPEMVEFFSIRLASKVFDEALDLYANNELMKVTFLIEEAHNLMQNPKGIFYRLAKEGRKYGIGLIYSTQSPSSIPMDILSQTENFLMKHVSSEDDVKALKRAKIAFDEPIGTFLLNEPVIAVSYIYMEPYQPFPVPVKVKYLDDLLEEIKRT